VNNNREMTRKIGVQVNVIWKGTIEEVANQIGLVAMKEIERKQ
jgi:hypothetical protein